MRNKRELHARLKGATLGDADDDADNTKTWLKKSKKRGKELEAKRLKEIESANNSIQDQYDESAWVRTVWNDIY